MTVSPGVFNPVSIRAPSHAALWQIRAWIRGAFSPIPAVKTNVSRPRAHAGTAAQILHNCAVPAAWPVTHAQHHRDMRVRQAVKAVGHNAVITEAARQSVQAVDVWPTRMKGRIKRADLQGHWQPLAGQSDNFQIGRLMQRRKCRQPVKLVNNRGIQNRRFR